MANVDKELTKIEPTAGTPDCPLCLALGDRTPNEQTLAAIRELREGGGTVLHGTIAELMADLDADDPDE